jgi:hypothetical protein
MKYKEKGYNRLLAGEVYNWELDDFESVISEENFQIQEMAKI